MPTTAEAFVLRGGRAGLEEVTASEPGPGEVAVDIRAAGVCHSDLHVLDGSWSVDRPLVLGHEAAGVVSSIGSGVRGVVPGDHVVLSWFAPCGRCARCAAGQAWLCTGTTALDNTLPGGGTPFADAEGEAVWPFLGLGALTAHVVVPESAAVVVPPELPFEVGAVLGCAVTTGVGAVTNTAGVRPGDSAVVVGCGGVGLSIILGLRLVGADPVIAVDVSDDKLRSAEDLGATMVIDAGQQDPVDAVLRATGGVDVAFEAIGRAETIESLPAMLAPGGAAVLVGMTPEGVRVRLDPFDLADRGKRILGCNYGSSVGQVDIPRLARLHLTGRLSLDGIIGRRRPPAQIQEAFEELRRGSAHLRTIITF